MQHQQTPPPRQKSNKRLISPEQFGYRFRLNDGSIPRMQQSQQQGAQDIMQQNDITTHLNKTNNINNNNITTATTLPSLITDNNDDSMNKVLEHLQRKCSTTTDPNNLLTQQLVTNNNSGATNSTKNFYPTCVSNIIHNNNPILTTTQPQTQILTNAALSNNNTNQLKSTTTSSQRVQRHHQIVSSSSTSSSSSSSSSSSALASELKQSSMKSDIAELKSSISEMKSLSEMSASLKNHQTKASLLHQQLRNSLENLMDTDTDSIVDNNGTSSEPVITFPDTPSTANTLDSCDNVNNYNDNHFNNYLSSVPNHGNTVLDNGQINTTTTADTLKFEQKRTHTASKTKVVVSDGFSAEKATANTAEMKSLQTNDLNFQQNKASAAVHAKVNIDGCLTAEKNVQKTKEQRSLKTSEMTQQDMHATARSAASVRLTGTNGSILTNGCGNQQIHGNDGINIIDNENDSFITAEKKATTSHSQQQRQTVTASSVYNHEKLVAASTQQSNITITTKQQTTGVHHHQTSSSSSLMTEQQKQMMSTSSSTHCSQTQQYDEMLRINFDDLDHLCSSSNTQDVERAIHKYSTCLNTFFKLLQKQSENQKQLQLTGSIGGSTSANSLMAKNNLLVPSSDLILNKINDIIRKAWSVPKHGHELGLSLCNALRTCGGLDLLMANCVVDDKNLQYSSAQLLEQCLTTENRAHVVDNGLDKVVGVACFCITSNEIDKSRIGTGILEHLFKHSEATCSDVIQLGGLDKVLFECRKNDVETLRHCAGALANLSLYGGADNQEKMIKRKVPMWLFPLAFHNDDNIKYYACLAIAVLVANKEIEAAVLKSGTLDLVEPFVTSHNPFDFAKSNSAHAHGQSKNWLKRLLPVLSSEREEARNLAAFHFCMEAGIKKQQGNTEIFQEIAAIEPLKKVASCPNAVASKFAAQALQLMGEEVPHKLSQQVPLWSIDDVREWVKQIGFNDYAGNFVESRVDGDLLLQLSEENLRCDIGLVNGIQRQRFTRELQNLKKMADYSSRDVGNLNGFLQSIGPEFSIYTYSMLNAGVDKDSIRKISEDQLVHECGITNSIHRLRILEAIRNTENNSTSPYFFNDYLSQHDNDKSLDVFVSYRRSNGSQLASLLKVHLQLRGFSVFIDVERLEAGKFDNNLLQSIKQAKHFLLVLTPTALERCIDDHDCKDWVHREIVAALNSQCNIIPIFDNFQWPKPEELPEDMRAVCHFNGVTWIHDYQDACIEKLERFLRGDMRADGSSSLMNNRTGASGASGSSKTSVTSTGGGSGSSNDNVTPGTPSIQQRQPPNYQRMHSNDSGSGKDVNGNSGGGGGKD